jgi:hypothetical protein
MPFASGDRALISDELGAGLRDVVCVAQPTSESVRKQRGRARSRQLFILLVSSVAEKTLDATTNATLVVRNAPATVREIVSDRITPAARSVHV